MQNKKSIVASALVAGALLTGISVNSASAFGFSHLGNGENVRTSLSGDANSLKNLEHACGAKTDSTKTTSKKTSKKSKDHKCGKDGKCGEGKCGGK